MWHCKSTGGYTIVRNITNQTELTQVVTQDGIDNGMEIANILHSRYSWTFNAIAGALSAIHRESGYNPWRWESDNIPTKASVDDLTVSRGYGLVQWTPCQYRSNRMGKYINNPNSAFIPGYGPNFSNVSGSLLDGEAQAHFMGAFSIGYEWLSPPKSTYPITFADWKNSDRDPGWLGVAWVANFERPASEETSAPYIRAGAALWYDYLTEHPFIAKKKSKWILYMRGVNQIYASTQT